jgi:SAM-dependent methyltransferase
MPASRRKSAARPTMASLANPHDLYERSVQDPENDVSVLGRLFQRFRGRPAASMREDFCGTAALSAQWARSKPDRWAIGVDLDEPTLAWGREHHLQGIKRVKLYNENVLDGVGARTDLGCALNFSYSVFKTRAQLRRYFEVARRMLVSDGLFIMDAWGGWSTTEPGRDLKKCDGFVYEWEQERFDPLTNEILCHIHFELPDGSRIDHAFTYDWRLWSVQELRELLEEAGFSQVYALWERMDDEGDGTGAYYLPKHTENMEVWWTYLVAER